VDDLPGLDGNHERVGLDRPVYETGKEIERDGPEVYGDLCFPPGETLSAAKVTLPRLWNGPGRRFLMQAENTVPLLRSEAGARVLPTSRRGGVAGRPNKTLDLYHPQSAALILQTQQETPRPPVPLRLGVPERAL
jgi:hypothetical protein